MPGASLAITTSLEEILRELTVREEIEPAVVTSLWDLVALPSQGHARASLPVGGLAGGLMDKQLAIARGAMCVLAMIARANADTVFTVTSLLRIKEILSR